MQAIQRQDSRRGSDRSWVEIDLDALCSNITFLRQQLRPGTEMLGVVKADAYGHGAVEVAQTMVEEGVEMLAVSMLDEAIELRQSGIQAPILLLSYSDPRRAGEIIDYDLTQAAYSWDLLEALNQAGLAKGRRARIHIKLDTGMGRIGFAAGFQALQEIQRMMALPGVSIEGIFTHFATADEEDPSYMQWQYRQFFSLCQELERGGVHIPMKHCCNSSATLLHPEYHMDMVRPGGVYYGFLPDNARNYASSIRPLLSLRSRVIASKEIEAGRSVSYGRLFVAQRKTRVVSVPLGYADGYSRVLSGKACALIHGRRVPQIGRICMDACMFDVTDLPEEVEVGTVVTFIGSERYEDAQGAVYEDEIRADEVASWMGTIDYEIATSIGKRVPHVFLRGGEARVHKYIVDEVRTENGGTGRGEALHSIQK